MIYDICIVGSGAGGAPIAYELSHAGYSVVVLEKGSHLSEENFSKDELAVSRRNAYTPPLSEEQHVINEREQGGTITRYIGSEYNWSFWNGSMVGGSSNLMSGFFHRMKPDDFKLKSTYGKINGANIVDWPISYDDLEPYYEKVERLIGVSGEVIKHPFLEPRSTKNFPFEPTKENKFAKQFDTACKKLGYHSLPLPRAILPHDALGRYGCSYSNFCGSYGCSTGAKGSARVALLNRCEAKVITNAFVYKLDSNSSSVTKAYYYDSDRKSHSIEAKIFVVAAQAIESSRLLLNSKNRYFPDGLANNSSQVGKNLLFSAGGSGEGRLRFENFTLAQQKELITPGLFFNRTLQDWYSYSKDKLAKKGGTIDFLFEHANIISRATSQFYNNDGGIIWGKALQEKVHKELTTSRVLTFEVFNDWLPTDYCNVTIDSEIKDKYGINVGAINLYSHPHDIEVGNYLGERGAKVLEEMGAEDISVNISSSPPPNLVAGGCRFGDEPKNSVLDKWCKAHELENLYVTDASFMPTGGSVPYTWTIYANSFRVANHILKILKKS